jgi:hypothetical protein
MNPAEPFQGMSRRQADEVAKALSSDSTHVQAVHINDDNFRFHAALIKGMRLRAPELLGNDPAEAAKAESVGLAAVHVMLAFIEDDLVFFQAVAEEPESEWTAEKQIQAAKHLSMLLKVLLGARSERQVLHATAHAGAAMKGFTGKPKVEP